MSHEVSATKFQTAVSLPNEADFDALVGADGVDVAAPAGCSAVHVARSTDAKATYDVSINGQLYKHLSKDQIKGLHVEQCAGDKKPAPASDKKDGAQVLQPADPKLVTRREKGGGVTVTELKNFNPPGWEDAGEDHQACYKLSVKGAEKTCAKGDSPVDGGGVILYPKVAGTITTNKDASAVALSQIKAHIDAGKAVIAGANIPAITYAVDKKSQPVTDHFIDVYGYEADSKGKVTAILARDNAVAGAPAIRMEVGADGSITKAGSVDPKTKNVAEMKYQLSEVRFHTSMPYTGGVRPMNDEQKGMVWWPKT